MPRLTAWTALLSCLLLWHCQVQAIDNVELRIGNWSFADYAAQGFELSVSLTASGLQLTGKAERLTLPKPLGQLDQLRLSCDETRLQAGQWQCRSGQLSFQHARLGSQNLTFSVTAAPQQERYQLTVRGLKLTAADMTVSADIHGASWQATIDADKLALAGVSAWLPLILNEKQLESLSNWDYQGFVGMQAKLAGYQQQLLSLDIDWQATELGLSNQPGTQVAESLAAEGQLEAKQDKQQWQWQASLTVDKGQAYSEPVFLDLDAQALSIHASGTTAKDFNAGDITQMQVEHDSVVSASADISWADNMLTGLSVSSKPAELDRLYSIWLQPFALGTAAAKLNTSGTVAVELDWEGPDYQVALIFEDANVDDEEGRFSMQQLAGQFGWSSSAEAMDTALSWTQARIYAVALGQASVKAQSHDNGLALMESLKLPIFDGVLQVNAFQLRQHDDGHVDWTFDGLLTPVSMESLSEALDWPPLHGKLSGVIPNVRYSRQELTIDGALQVKVFDGTTVIRDLRMLSPLGSLPQLYANIDINSLDLELLTRTFDFGRITGRLEGHVHNLRLSNWKPVQFNARLATPAQDPGKRRISQKAVDNLTQIGGGASGMLSRSFLRFFDDFSYQKLGLACRLQNEVCQMSGIEEAEQGYYIVKGGGLPPWINVVGYTRRVDWPDLIARLLAVQDSSGPVIQ